MKQLIGLWMCHCQIQCISPETKQLHSLIYSQTENSAGQSTIDKCEHVGVSLSSNVTKVSRQIDKDITYQKQYRVRKVVVLRQLKCRDMKYYAYKHNKNTRTNVGYRKGLLDPKLNNQNYGQWNICVDILLSDQDTCSEYMQTLYYKINQMNINIEPCYTVIVKMHWTLGPYSIVMTYVTYLMYLV